MPQNVTHSSAAEISGCTGTGLAVQRSKVFFLHKDHRPKIHIPLIYTVRWGDVYLQKYNVPVK